MNQRLANKHAKMLNNGTTSCVWDACPKHMIYFPKDDVCAECAPSDPVNPMVGNPVRINKQDGCLVSRGKITFVDSSIIEINYSTVVSRRDWLGEVEPDWINWKTLPPPKPVSTPRINGIFTGDNGKCFSCGYPNPYPADNACNHEKGWQCSRCKIVEQMQ